MTEPQSGDEDRLAAELASLRIDRGPDGRPGERGRTADRGRVDVGRRRGVPVWLYGAALLGLLLVGGYFVARGGEGRFFPPEVELGSVSLISPAQAEVTLVATGYVYPLRRANVAPKTTGRLATLLVHEGSQVKAGELIAQLEPAQAEAALAQVHADVAAAEAKVQSARVEVDDANTRFVREKQLLSRGAGTQAAYDDASSRLATARAALFAAQAEVRATAAREAAAKVELENTRVRAPFDGTVIHKLTEVGEVLGPASPGIVTIASLDDLEVQADVSESQIGKIKVGTPAEILLDAFPDKRFRGQVREIRQMVDRAKASVTVKVKFVDPTAGVLPDMAAKVSFLARPLDDAALKAPPKRVVSADSIVERAGQKVVFTVADGRAHAVPISTGGSLGDLVELVSGPAPGTRIIEHVPADLQNGAAVKEKKD